MAPPRPESKRVGDFPAQGLRCRTENMKVSGQLWELACQRSFEALKDRWQASSCGRDSGPAARAIAACGSYGLSGCRIPYPTREYGTLTNLWRFYGRLQSLWELARCNLCGTGLALEEDAA